MPLNQTDQIASTWKYEYRDNIELALQQKVAKFGGSVSMGSYTGEGARPVMRVGEATMRPRSAARYGPMVPEELSIETRWVTPIAYHVGPHLADHVDKARNGIEITGTYVRADVAAIQRQKDDSVIAAFRAAAPTGKNGSATTAYDTNMDVAAGGTGLTVAKLRAAQVLLLNNEVDLDEETPCLGITPQQHDDLLADIQVTSRDFNGGAPVLKEGRIAYFMGFEFKMSTRLVEESANTRACPFWVKSGMHLGMWEDMKTDISPRYDLEGIPTQVYAEVQIGATRTDEKRVGHILCTEP